MSNRLIVNDFKYVASSFWKHRNLIYELTKRDISGRYRGSLFGLAWSFFTPLLMLAVYTFVFSVVFQAKWQINVESNKINFAIIIFAGIIIHSLFSECINRAPSLITSNASFVKKVVFPLEILPLTVLGGALFHFFISMLILLVTQQILMPSFSINIIFFPLILLPLLFIILGITWFFSSLGVFLKDISQLTGILTTVLLFLSPIFFPISAVQEKYRFLLYANPLTYFIEEARNILLLNTAPQWKSLINAYIISIPIMLAGLWWFQKTRKGFADVL